MNDDRTVASPDLVADLQSSDPASVIRALEELDDRRQTGREVMVQFPGVDVLGAPDEVPDDQLALLLRLVLDYSSFDPPLEWLQRIQLATEALVRYGGGQSSYQVAIAFQLGVDPVGAVREALHYLWVRGFNSQLERASAARLISDLLDAPGVRHAVLDGLRGWIDYPEMAGVVHEILPQLEESESRQLLDNDE
jgi:hypothetical protein